MNNTIHISVIIPCYNAEKTLQSAIDSVLAQTYPHKEIIIIDGGSTDQSVSIIERNAPNIAYWVSEYDRGVYDAINKGLQASTGQFIYVLGADDQLASDEIFEHVVHHIEPDIDLIFGHVRNIHISHPLVPEVHTSQFSSTLIWKNTLHQQSCFYRKTLFESEQFNPDYKILGDYDFHLGLWRKKVKTFCLDQTIAICEAAGLSKQVTKKLYKEELRIKNTRLTLGWYLLSIPWVALKYFRKALYD